MGRDRRRYARVGVQLNISVEAAGTRWDGKTVDLSPYGVKVSLPPTAVKFPTGTKIQLRCALPDGGAPLSLIAGVVRTDRDGIALAFLNLEAGYFELLKGLVDSLLGGISDGPARLEVNVRSVRERRKHPRTDAALDVSFDAEKPYDWRGKTINLSPVGMKLACPASAIRPTEGTTVKLRLTPSAEAAPIPLKGMVWRREPKSMAMIFVELGREELERLRDLVELLAQPA